MSTLLEQVHIGVITIQKKIDDTQLISRLTVNDDKLATSALIKDALLFEPYNMSLSLN